MTPCRTPSRQSDVISDVRLTPFFSREIGRVVQRLAARRIRYQNVHEQIGEQRLDASTHESGHSAHFWTTHMHRFLTTIRYVFFSDNSKWFPYGSGLECSSSRRFRGLGLVLHNPALKMSITSVCLHLTVGLASKQSAFRPSLRVVLLARLLTWFVDEVIFQSNS